MNMEPLADKYLAFGWEVREVDGNDIGQVVEAMDQLVPSKDKPSVLIGNTIRGKGVSFLEGNVDFHYTRLSSDLKEKAEKELIGDWDAED
jgi:transketolase